MTDAEILELAKEHHAEIQRPFAPHEFSIHAYLFNEHYLITFALAIAQRTRDECAAECATLAKSYANSSDRHIAFTCAEAIRSMK